MFPEPTLLQALAFVTVMLVAGLVHGTLGMGFQVVATPMLALFADLRSAILITLLPTDTVNLLSIARGGNWFESLGRFWPLAVRLAHKSSRTLTRHRSSCCWPSSCSCI
jgi:uncharacterized membrane protein YfcA